MKHLLLNKSAAALGALLALAVAGCDRDHVKVYHVETNDTVVATPPPMAAPAAPTAAMPGQMPTTMPAGLAAPDKSALPPLTFTAPDGWTEKPASQMRVASFAVSADGKSADISVIPLGGMAGGAAANVTRWRGQIGLPPVTDDEAVKLAEKVSVGDQPAELYDLDGGAQRIIAVSYRRDDTAWFFKMTGDATLVEAQKPAFISFLKTVQFGASAK